MGHDKHDEVRGVPERFCKYLWKSPDMKVCIWHKMVCIWPEMVLARPKFGLHQVCEWCETMLRCSDIIRDLVAFPFA